MLVGKCSGLRLSPKSCVFLIEEMTVVLAHGCDKTDGQNVVTSSNNHHILEVARSLMPNLTTTWRQWECLGRGFLVLLSKTPGCATSKAEQLLDEMAVFELP